MLRPRFGSLCKQERLNTVRFAIEAKGDDHLDVATALCTLVALYMENSKYEEAERMLTDALRIRRLALGLDHPDVGVTQTKLGKCPYVLQVNPVSI